jgi:type I restriction enzyme S subunit
MTGDLNHTQRTDRVTRTGGRPAIEGVIRGRYALSVGNPGGPVAEGWQWTKLTDIARLESGHTPSRRHPEYWDGNIPWIGIRDATANHGRTLSDTIQHINTLGIKNSSARILPQNTVCLSRTASVGYVVTMGRPMTTSQDFVNWICSDSLDYRFLKYVLLAENESYAQFASGTTHQTIYYPEVKAFHICVPPLQVQRRVAGILSVIDSLVENIRRRVAVLEEIALALYREWFVNFRFPGHEAAQYIETPLGPLPRSWSVGRVDSHFVLQRGFDLPSSYRESGTVPIIGASGTQGFHSTAKVVGPGVTTGRSGTVGVVTYVPEDFWPLNTSLWVKEFRLSTPRHAYFLLASLDLTAASSGAAVPTLNRNIVHALPVASPPRELIQQWDAAAAPAFKYMTVLRRESRHLTQMRDLLLPRLVSGQIDISTLDLDALAAETVA